ncbi:phage head-tail adaptor [Rhizobium sp. PDO1-076]|uniref:phage head closure protein n=1 Tax=Rhizobium sp. PDO1-076 TaxID=1125979 RepID=UPI00024E2E94|nr:phage head closure protein [Rhizobium sp. PDO1-076]EHS52930.1 phage head-tail adaptor [Rhizobium sp. PDO1-076]
MARLAAMLDLDPGRLTARLVLERPDPVGDGQGGAEIGFVELARVWALIEPLRFAEEERAAGVAASVTHHVTLRARADLAPGQRFRKGMRLFVIAALCDPDETGRYALARCREDVG